MNNPKNLIYQKTSFLSKANSAFIEEMYVKYIENDPSLPSSWREYFEDLNENIDFVSKEIEGPSWKPQRKKIIPKKYSKHKSIFVNSSHNTNDLEQQKKDSIKAIALIRAYRIRGHLIADLDPLKLMKRDYLNELHPSDHGFKKEDYDKKIFLSSYMDLKYASINDILKKL